MLRLGLTTRASPADQTGSGDLPQAGARLFARRPPMIEVAPFVCQEEWAILPAIIFAKGNDLICGQGNNITGWQLRLQWLDFGLSLTVTQA